MPKQQEFLIEKFSNGCTLLGEVIDSASSVAVSILIPVGSSADPEGKEGLNSILCEMFSKGAGSWSTKDFSELFDSVGIHRSHSAGVEYSIFSAAMLAENLDRALELLGIMLLSPKLPVDELESVRQLALQDLHSLEDEPSSKVMVELCNRFYPAPYNRSQLGTIAGVNSIDIEAVKAFYKKQIVGDQAIIAIAGKFSWSDVLNRVRSIFGSWGGSRESLKVGACASSDTVHHIYQETNQVQISLAYPSVPYGDPYYYSAKVAVNILSGGMAGRLFIEVREKRGLVYRVGASHSASRGRPAIFAYAGTTPENAVETLDLILKELCELANGVTDEELDRAKVDLKSRLVMQSESSSARAAILANDWWNIGRVRTISEIKSEIDAVSKEKLLSYLLSNPVKDVTLVTLGTGPIESKFWESITSRFPHSSPK